MAEPRHWQDDDLERLRDAQRARARLAELSVLLRRLSRRQREVWFLRQLGYSYGQGAAILGVAPSTFASHVVRARRKQSRG